MPQSDTLLPLRFHLSFNHPNSPPLLCPQVRSEWVKTRFPDRCEECDGDRGAHRSMGNRRDANLYGSRSLQLILNLDPPTRCYDGLT